MTSKNCAATAVRLIVIAILAAAPLGAAGGLDRPGARTFELQRDLRALRAQVERAPHASSFDLKELQRRLHERRIDEAQAPGLQDLALERRQDMARRRRERILQIALPPGSGANPAESRRRPAGAD